MRLLFLGDLAYDYSDVKEDIKKIGRTIRENDLRAVINLEGPICDGTERQRIKRGSHLHQGKGVIDVLKELSAIGVTLSNNHMMDFGSLGCRKTIERLDDAGILYCGAGSDIHSAVEPMILKDEMGETAVFNFGWAGEETVYAGKCSYGCSPRENKIVLDNVKHYAVTHPQNSVIVTLHWGFEFNAYPMPYDIDLGHKLLEIPNVRIVIGHHPHCPQTVEEYKGKKIYYSLGNFYFGSRRKKFSMKKFPTEPVDRSNYGIAVVFDTVTGESSEKIVFYDEKKDESYFTECGKMPEKQPDADPLSKDYLKLYRNTALKGNPFLGTDEKMNRKMTAQFNFARNVLRFVPFTNVLLKLVKRK
ncbi:capsule synthesis protein PGA_cap [Lachnospiraceae bacterium]|nr:capsule synthesis protein PGA_cap [Lachnospiraceae bacterium]